MSVNLGTASGSLTLNANSFFSAIKSAAASLSGFNSKVDATQKNLTDLEQQTKSSGKKFENLSGKISGLGTKIQGISPSINNLGNSLKTVGQRATEVGKKMTLKLTTPIVAVATASVKTAADFDSAMSQVQATMGASKSDMTELRKTAEKMGEKTKYTATEAAQALNYLALAGYDSKQMMAALPKTLDLAAAGGMDLATASDMVTDGLSAMGLASKDSATLQKNLTTMVDQFAKTSSKSNTSVAQLGEAILTVGGTAKSLKGGLAEANTAIGLLSNNGIHASEAGTHLRNIILAMNPTTEDAAKAFSNLGVSAYDSEGNLKSLQDIFGELNAAMAGMSDQEKSQILSKIFNKTDLAAVDALLSTTTQDWTSLNNAISDSAGAGSKMAATQLDNFNGQLTLLKSKLQAVAIQIGEVLIPEIQPIIDKFSEWIDKFASLDEKTKKTIINVGLFVAVMGPIVSIVGKTVTVVGSLVKFISLLVKGFGKLVSLGSGIPKLFSGLSAAAKTLGSGLSKIPGLATSAMSKLGSVVSGAFTALKGPVSASLGTVGAVILAAIGGWSIGTWLYDHFSEEIDSVLYPIYDAVSAAWDVIAGFFTETIPNFFSGLWESISSGFMTIINSVTELFSNIGEWINTNIIQPVISVVSPVVEKIKEIILKVWEIITTLFSVAATWVKNHVISPIVNLVTSFAKKIKSIFKSIWSGIKSIFGAVASWFKKHVINPIVSLFTTLGHTIKSIFAIAWSGVKTVWGGVKAFFSTVWGGVKSVFSGVKTFFVNIFSGAVNGIKKVFRSIKSFFAKIWGGIKSIFSSAATAIANTFTGAFKSAFNGVVTMIEGIVNFFVKSINGAIKIINKIPGVEIGKLEELSLPRLAVGLDYVPYDGYTAMLHKGERVMTAQENKEYTEKRNSSNGDTFIFNSPKAIDEIEATRQIKKLKKDLAEGF